MSTKPGRQTCVKIDSYCRYRSSRRSVPCYHTLPRRRRIALFAIDFPPDVMALVHPNSAPLVRLRCEIRGVRFRFAAERSSSWSRILERRLCCWSARVPCARRLRPGKIVFVSRPYRRSRLTEVS